MNETVQALIEEAERLIRQHVAAKALRQAKEEIPALQSAIDLSVQRTINALQAGVVGEQRIEQLLRALKEALEDKADG